MGKIIGLVGNQNSGKTTLFNFLTGMNQKVGNWPGVTIERKEGYIKGTDHILVDTPGVYSLSPYTDEEKVTRKFALEAKPDVIINIIDATSLERSLYLTTQLGELSTDIIIACNMSDILESNGITLDPKRLEKTLGHSVVLISAKKGDGVNELIDLIKSGQYLKNPHKKIYQPIVQQEIDHLESDLNHELEEASNPKFAAVKLFERDPYFRALTNASTEEEIEKIEQFLGMDSEQIFADERYKFVTAAKEDCCIEKPRKTSTLSDKIDTILLNKYLAIPIFILVLALVYFISISIVGGLTSDFIDALFNGSESIVVLFSEVPFQIKGLGPLIGEAILEGDGHVWAADLVASGVINAFSSVLNFVPQLMALFICLSILDASGYMSRIAFFLDRIFKKFGLSGKSLIPFIVGSGCSVPGILSARTLEDDKERKMTIILTPFIPCSAKLPIIALLAGAIFPSQGWIVSLSLYFLAIIVILLSAIVMKKRVFKSSQAAFISELPRYRFPSFSYVGRETYDKTTSFIKRAGTVIVLFGVVVWVLSRFSWNWTYVGPETFLGEMPGLENSMLASIGKGIAYLSIPMLGGQYSWGAAVSAIQGIIAKEQVVSSMAVLSGFTGSNIVSNPQSIFHFFASNSWGAYAFMTFNLFSIPCVAAVSAMKKELGNRKVFAGSIAFELVFSFVFASLIGTVGWALNGWVVSGI